MPPDEDLPRDTAPTSDPATERRTELRKALDRHAKKLERKLEALGGDLAEAGRGAEWRRYGETLLAYAHLVPSENCIGAGRSATLPSGAPPSTQRTMVWMSASLRRRSSYRCWIPILS